MNLTPLELAIRKLASHNNLTTEDSSAAFDVVMSGNATPSQIAALLTGLRVARETPEVVAGAAQSLRAAMIKLPVEDPDGLVDTCGTGGGSITTFNISTAAALVAAGAGVRIAKHGNRSFTSKCGSADVLEALGVNIQASPDQMAATLKRAGIVFMFAPTMHPAMRHVAPVRKELGIPTVMNIIGPLANPAGVKRQVIGVADREKMELIAGALERLGTTHSMVVHGEPGMDEISPLGTTHVIEIKEGSRSEWKINPADYGYPQFSPGDLAGGDAAYNARIIEDLPNSSPAQQAAVILNAAAAIYVSGSLPTYGEAIKAANKSLTEGKGREALQRLKTTSSF